jgi:hypothetical protein
VIAAAGLLAYAGLLLAAAALARARWPDRAPRLAVAAWFAVTSSAVASVTLGGLALLVPTGFSAPMPSMEGQRNGLVTRIPA